VPVDLLGFYLLSACVVGFAHGAGELSSFAEALFVGLFWPVCLLWALYEGAKEFFRAN
jgi:hypothetical protein